MPGRQGLDSAALRAIDVRAVSMLDGVCDASGRQALCAGAAGRAADAVSLARAHPHTLDGRAARRPAQLLLLRAGDGMLRGGGSAACRELPSGRDLSVRSLPRHVVQSIYQQALRGQLLLVAAGALDVPALRRLTANLFSRDAEFSERSANGT